MDKRAIKSFSRSLFLYSRSLIIIIITYMYIICVRAILKICCVVSAIPRCRIESLGERKTHMCLYGFMHVCDIIIKLKADCNSELSEKGAKGVLKLTYT